MRRIFAVLSVLVPALAAPAAERPNILLIVADDLGYTDIGAFGSEIDTPNLDALANRGVRFSNFHTSVSCSPTRSMLMTGTDNHIAGLGNMAELLTDEQRGQPGYEGHLNDNVATLAEVLREAGYHTYMAGKWHLGDEPENYPHARGFERSFSMLQGGASHWSDMTGLQAGTQPIAKYVRDDQELDKLPADFYSSRSYADELIDQIRADRGDGKPFLAYLAFTAAHDPVHAPEPWLSKYAGRYDEGYGALKEQRIKATRALGIIDADAIAADAHPMVTPWDELTAEEQRYRARVMEAYAGMVDCMDYNAGRVIDFLDDIGELDNTIIIFTSDNGPNPWETVQYPGNEGTEWMEQFDDSYHNIGRRGSFIGVGIGWATASAGPLDYFKLTVGEGGVRTPLIIAGPGIDAGAHSDAFAYVWDLMPTILELTGVEHADSFNGRPIAPMRGRSITPLLTGDADAIYAPDEYIGAEMHGGTWIRKGDYKAVSITKPYGPGHWQLFNTVLDPGETNDLADAEPDLLAELIAAWEIYADDVGVVRSND